MDADIMQREIDFFQKLTDKIKELEHKQEMLAQHVGLLEKKIKYLENQHI